MPKSNALTWSVLWLTLVSALGVLCLLKLSGRNVQAAPAQGTDLSRQVLIIDGNGHLLRSGTPSATSQLFDVSVGPGTQNIFSPSTVTITVGDTVRWTWDSSRHNVTSGVPCAVIDSQFCSPNDTNCLAPELSNIGTVYQHTFTQVGTFAYFCTNHCALGMTGTVTVNAPPCTAPPPNMAGWWTGDGNLRDIAGGNNGTLLGGATFAAGIVGQAFILDGVDDSVVIHHQNNLNPTGPFSVDAWVKGDPQQSSNQSLIVDKSHGFIDSTGWAIQTDTAGAACFFFGTGGAGVQDFHGTCTQATVLDAQWHHLAGVWTGTEIQIYRDGVLQSSLPFTIPPVNNMRDMRIAAAWGGGSPTRFFHGLVDEVEYFNRALTLSEIQAIVAAGSSGKCKPPQPVAAVSSKIHGAAGTFDVDLKPFAVAGVECRTGGASGVHRIVVQFGSAISVANARILGGTGVVSGVSTSGATATIDLSGVTNAQTLFVALEGVNDGSLSGDVPIALGVLVGDANGSGGVSASDIGQVKALSGQAVTGTNFRSDVTASGGTINASDIGLVKSVSGSQIP